MKKNSEVGRKISALLSLAVFSTSYISSQISNVHAYSNISEISKISKNSGQISKPFKSTSIVENKYGIKDYPRYNTSLQTQSSDLNKNKIKTEKKVSTTNADKQQSTYYDATVSTSSSANVKASKITASNEAGSVVPSIKKIYTVPYGDYSQGAQDLNNGQMSVNVKDVEKIIIEFNDNDIIKKDNKGSSVYAGIGNLPNDLIKLEKLDGINKIETELNLSGVNNYGNNIIKLVDNTESGENDEIIINTTSSMNMEGLVQNSAYKLLIGNITDEAGNKITNPQTLNFSTGPAPVLQLNREESNVENSGSSINSGSLITDVKVDGSYNGFVLDTGYSDKEDMLTNVNVDTIKVYENGSSTPLSSDAYSVVLSPDGKKIIIKPNANGLQKNKTYAVVVNGVKDIEGNPIGNIDGSIKNQYRFYFQTGDGTVLSVGKVYMTYDEFGMYKNKERDLKDGATGVFADQNSYYHNIVIEFNDNDIIKKNSLGSSVYAGNGILINDLVKLVKVDNLNGNETQVDLSGKNRYGYEQVRVLDNTDLNSEGKDKIIISANSSINMPGIIENSKYKLIIGDITSASGNIISNPQSIGFVTGPSPMLGLNKVESSVNNIGSSLNAGSLITDIKIDGSYSGFIVESVWSYLNGYVDLDDKLTNVNANTVKIYENGSSTPIENDKYEVSLSTDGKKITIKPNANGLEKNKTYEVVVNGVTDIEGNPIGNIDGSTKNQYKFYFQTGDGSEPSVAEFHTGYMFKGNHGEVLFGSQSIIHDGSKDVASGIFQNQNSIVVLFNHKDIIKKNSLGSSVYAGKGVLANDLIKLTRTDNITQREQAVDISQTDVYGNRVIQFKDDTEKFGDVVDEIVITVTRQII
ncbi:Ig-like domain-containing protein [Clostridium sp. JS66]|uniref:Ig-like domain-containing protein n=1 Tax=Clostridium sp. JS66 TaxID=3064705 RepID=UPI00298DFE55|nr:Ig-like domain-containing protein [Clostridium sp. JS66]WPC40534.1 Ig-like domain-containing protein [Clostridium sp. JS66]